MMPVVRTDQGATVLKFVPGTSDVPLSAEQAQSLAAEKNRKAEELGIKTRYVVEDN